MASLKRIVTFVIRFTMSFIALMVVRLLSTLVSSISQAADVISHWHKLEDEESTPGHREWKGPVASDSRSPCPMLNALANHGYLPRDGKNISIDRLVEALEESINLAASASTIAGFFGLPASTTGIPLTFHLADLAKHGVIEHDGSLSRHDATAPPAINNDNLRFAPEVWETVVSEFEEGTISIKTAARARKKRIAAARVQNPNFHMSEMDWRASVLETAAYLLVFGKGTDGGARRDWVRILFEEERLPFDEGFQRSAEVIRLSDVVAMQVKVEAEDNWMEADEMIASGVRRRDF